MNQGRQVESEAGSRPTLLRFANVHFAPQWDHTNPETGFRYRSGVIPGVLFFSSMSGDITGPDAEQAIPSLERVYREGGLRDTKPIRVVDYSGVRKSTLAARKIYARTINRLTLEYNCPPRTTYICGANLVTRSALRVFAAFVRQHFVFVDTVEAAFEQIRSRNDEQDNGPETATVTRRHLDEIHSLCSRLLWEDDLESGGSLPLSPDNPLGELQATLDVIKADLDEMREAEQRQARYLQSVFQSIQTGIVVVDDATHEIVFVNATAAEIARTTPEEMIGKQCHRYICPAEHGKCPISDLGQTVDRSERVLLRKDGTRCPVLKSVKVFEFQGRTSLLENFIDISDLKQAQQDANAKADQLDLLARDLEEKNRVLDAALTQAQAASRTRDEFLNNMSHELRTPMNGVIGMATLLLDTTLDEEQLDYVQTIQTSASALLSIISDILDFSRVEQGQLDLEREPFDARTVIRDVGRMFSSQVREKGLGYTEEIDPAVPALLEGSPNRLRQILVNLVNNAIKFTDSGTVTIRLLPAQHRGTAINLRCEVEDTGIGISADRRETLFAPFVQADGSSTRKYGGTGLGLSLSRRLVEMMGGQMGVEGEVGQGSTFWFTVPFEIGTDQPAPAIDRPVAETDRPIG
jgi:PAS domain S-box-containing protein